MKKNLNLMNLMNEQLSNKEMEELNGGLYIRIGHWGFEIREGGVCSYTCLNENLTEGATDNNNGNIN
jgi:hypothetical protein